MANDDQQWWLRNQQGRVWGPYTVATLDRVRGQVTERAEASNDGKAWRPCTEFAVLKELLAPAAEAPRTSRPPPPRESAREAQHPREPLGVPVDFLAVLEARLGNAPLPGGEPAPAITRPPPAPQPPPPEPEKPLEVPEEGALEEWSPVRLYAVAASTNATGWLQLETENGRMLVVSFRRGAPDHLSSDDPDLSLARFLQKRGTLTAAQGLQAEEQAQRAGVDIVTALFQLSLIPPADAHRLLGEFAAFLLDRALLTWRGKFSFERDAPSPPGAFPLGAKWQLLAASIRRLDVAPVRARLGKRLLRPVQRSGGLGIGKVEELALTAHEARLYAAIDGVRTGEELLKATDPSATLRVLFLLTELGHLSFAGDDSEAEARAGAPKPSSEPPPPVAAAAPPPAATSTPPPATTSTPPGGQPRITRQAPTAELPPRKPPPVMQAAPHHTPTSVKPVPKAAPKPATEPARAAPPARPPSSPPAVTRTFVTGPPDEAPEAQAARLQAIWLQLQDKNHFEVMGLERKAAPAEVKRVFFLLARELHPDTVLDGQPVLREIKGRLFTRINEASQVLQDDKRRKDYEEELDGKANKVDVARIFAAEEAFQKGEIMIKARKYREGLTLVEEAIILNDQEAEFYAWRGWAQFLLATDRKAQLASSVADCKKAIAMIPVCVPAHLFIALMSKALGDLKLAESYFRKVLELEPKHVDAQRELRLMGAKKG